MKKLHTTVCRDNLALAIKASVAVYFLKFTAANFARNAIFVRIAALQNIAFCV